MVFCADALGDDGLESPWRLRDEGGEAAGVRGAMQADGAAGECDEVVAAGEELEDAGEEAAVGGQIGIHDRPRGGAGDLARLVVPAGFDAFVAGETEEAAEASGRWRRLARTLSGVR